MGFNLNGINLVFRQHAASIYGFVRQFVSLFVWQKKNLGHF